jgi:chloramphenicol-sensitive protein RarD
VPPLEVMAHRILWSAVFMAILLAVRGGYGTVLTALGDRRVFGMITLSALLIAVNWLTYVATIGDGHVLEASLGYFISPLTNVLLGRLVLGERLTWGQGIACLVAGAAVAVLGFGASGEIWRSLVLAVSFGCYGLVRKMVRIEALPGFALECMVLVPLAAGYLGWKAWTGEAAFSLSAPGLSLLLAASGVLTSVPLIAYASAARSLKLSTIGLMQYITPSIQFVLGTLVWGEAFGMTKLLGFACIWAALCLYSFETVRVARRPV